MTDTVEIDEAEARRRRGGRPRVPDHLKKNTPRITFRIPTEDREEMIEGPRKARGLGRTAYIMRMIRAAHAHRDEWDI